MGVDEGENEQMPVPALKSAGFERGMGKGGCEGRDDQRIQLCVVSLYKSEFKANDLALS